MSFSEQNGDIFKSEGLDAIAHGVNCKGPMGGFAGLVKSKYPEMSNHYRELCNRRLLKPGNIFHWHEEGSPNIYNLATQENPGPDAKYEYIDASMKTMLSHAEAHGVRTIGIPQIGCGIGGLEWPKTRELIRSISEKSPVHVVAFSYEEHPKSSRDQEEQSGTINL